MSTKKTKIFLSYAHEDIAMAKRIYKDLKRYGLEVWIDCENLLPGQNWKITIEKNIRQSQYYLLLLSSHSLTKRGFIQKEMKIAYEVLENCSEEDIYLIPVRLNECEPSFKISDIHYIDVFPESEYQNGFKKILQVVSPETFLLRNKPKRVSGEEVNETIRIHDFYDHYRNPAGKGISHQYEEKILNSDRVIIDTNTSLMWQQSGSNEDMNFEDAKDWIEKINKKDFAGFNDWRLPTVEEAMSLFEKEHKADDMHIDSIFEDTQKWIWTSDISEEKLYVWVASFNYGWCDPKRLNKNCFVRAVRSINYQL